MAQDYSATTVLITGASSGIGATFAAALAARGASLVLVARRRDRLDALAERLRQQHGVEVRVIALDLAKPGATAQLRAQLEHVRIDSLINNAGFGMHGALVDADAARIDEQVQLNIAALTSLTRAFLPELVASGRGVLVNVASTAAFQPVPSMAVYGASKAYVLSFTEALAHETRGTGLHVIALCPGATATEFFDVVGTERARVGAAASVDDVVAAALAALDRRRVPAVVVPGAANRFGAGLARILPRGAATALTARLMSRGREAV